MDDILPWVEGYIRQNKAIVNACGINRKYRTGRGFPAAPETLNPFHRVCFTILHLVADMERAVIWSDIEWHDHAINVPVEKTFSTSDDFGLTKLVLMAHIAKIKISISAYDNMYGILISFQDVPNHPCFKGAIGEIGRILSPYMHDISKELGE